MSASPTLVLQVFKLVDANDLQGMAEYLTPDIDFINPFGPCPGRENVVKLFEERAGAFPDSEHIMRNVYDLGDTVALEGEWTGTNSGPLPTPNGPVTTGKTVRFPFAGICRVDGGLVSAVHIYHDLLTMFTQLGLA